MRIVSLVPSVTETLLAWGVEPVAVTRFCEQPERRQVGGTKNPDVAAIVALAPDLVVMDREENRAVDAAALEAHGLALHVLHVTALADVASALAGLAAAVGVGAVPATVPPAVPATDATPAIAGTTQAFIPIWRRPWMSIGEATYGSTLLAAAGVANILTGPRDPYPHVTLEEVAAMGPDVVLAPSEPYPFGERHRAELETVAPAVFIDGRDLFWWGVRTPAALHRLRILATELEGGVPSTNDPS